MNCEQYVNCPNPPSFPLLGYSAETPDVMTYQRMGFGPSTPPPLNWSEGLLSGFAIGYSTASSAAAQIAANKAAVAQAVGTWTAPGALAPIAPAGEGSLIEEITPIY